MDVRVEEGLAKGPYVANGVNIDAFPREAMPQNVNRETEKCPQQCVIQWLEFLKTFQFPQMKRETSQLVEPVSWKDATAFLASFEHVAEACQWPKEEWVAQLLPALSGEAENAFHTLEGGDKEDYGKVKTAILQGEAIKMETWRQQFRQFRYQEVDDPQKVYGQLRELCHQWLRPDRHTKEQILELLILEQILTILPQEIQNRIKEEGVESCFLSSQPEARAWKQQEPLQEMTRSSLETETAPSAIAQRQIYKEPKEESAASRTTSSPSYSGSVFCPDGWKMAEVGQTQEVMDLKDMVMLNPTQAPMYWAVVQEEYGNIESSGGLDVIPKPEAFCKREPEEIVPIQISEAEETLPGSVSAHGRSPSENDHGDSQQDSPELREVSGTVTGEGQDFISLRPKTGALRPRWRLRQQDCQEKEKGDPAQGGANAAVVEMVVVAPRKEKRYECPECGHQARYLSEFIGHMGTHTRAYAGKRSHQCVECRKTFRQAAALYGHLRIHRSKSDSSNTKESFPKSFGSENQKMPNGKKQRNKARVENLRQRRAKPGEGNLPAEESPGKSAAVRKQDLESKEQRDGKVAKAPNEPIKLAESDSPMKEATRHMWVKRLLYSQCGKPYPVKSKAQGESTEKEFYSCPWCGKTFQKKHSLEDHQRIHTREKLYECPECGKKFHWSKWMIEHQRFHTGQKPFLCPECGKHFRWRTVLRSHQRAETE